MKSVANGERAFPQSESILLQNKALKNKNFNVFALFRIKPISILQNTYGEDFE
jgi:hypothetical protein